MQKLNKYKRKYLSNTKKSILMLLLLILLLGVGYSYLTTNLYMSGNIVVSKPPLLEQIQNLVNDDTCLNKYSGEVTDQVGQTVTASNVYFNQCANKRNIIFNNICWQMIRSTETGGIKMIYNGDVVNGKCESTRGDHKGIVQSDYSIQTIDNSYLYGESFTYDITNNTFTLTDTETATWSDSTYEDLIGKFTCKTNNNTCTIIYQINTYISNTQANASSYSIANTNYASIGTSSYNSDDTSLAKVGYMFNKTYNFSKQKGDIEYVSGNTYSYGNSYTDNGNGTYTINSATQLATWPTSYSDYNKTQGKYICKNPINDTCSEVWYVTSPGESSFYYFSMGKRYKFASSFVYENGTYTLSGENDSFWDLSSSNYRTYLYNHHYTCWNNTGTCNTLSYVYFADSTISYYVDLNSGESISDAVNEILYSNDVNRYNSSVKGIIDAWYAKELSTKTNFLEDTVYCNDRSITRIGGFDPNGGNINYLLFKNSSETTNLTCLNITDQFSVSNNKAKLKYPVALLQEEEKNNINDSSILLTGVDWLGLSPRNFMNVSIMRYVTSKTYMMLSVSYDLSVRPVISLSSNASIIGGDGSEVYPFIIKDSN